MVRRIRCWNVLTLHRPLYLQLSQRLLKLWKQRISSKLPLMHYGICVMAIQKASPPVEKREPGTGVLGLTASPNHLSPLTSHLPFQGTHPPTTVTRTTAYSGPTSTKSIMASAWEKATSSSSSWGPVSEHVMMMAALGNVGSRIASPRSLVMMTSLNFLLCIRS
jgi:hypothetical protein